MASFELSCGPYAARILPEQGGLIGALSWRAADGQLRQLLRRQGALAPSFEDTAKFGSWAMLPFANRAFDGVVDDGVRRFSVPGNDPAGAIHGFGWQASWGVLDRSDGHTVLEHCRSAGPDPYRYRARQTISLDQDGMTVSMTVTNAAETALPFGFGFHPWFACAADTRLRMSARGALLLGPRYRASGAVELDAGGPYAQGDVFFAKTQETAWSFLGWDGVARIETPSAGLAIMLTASETLRCPVVWAPAGADFLCVEPQSHAIGSPSEPAARKAAPLTQLEPGATLEGWMRIAAGALEGGRQA